MSVESGFRSDNGLISEKIAFKSAWAIINKKNDTGSEKANKRHHVEGGCTF